MHTVLGFFLHILPLEYFKAVILQATNIYPFAHCDNSGRARRMFWSNDQTDTFVVLHLAYMHAYISRRCFEAILKHIKFTTRTPLAFKDSFHPVSELIDAFNKHSAACFSPSLVSCLDESMSVWTCMWTCSGWMFVPRKATSKGEQRPLNLLRGQ
jgi:hypothetical protein